MSGDRSVNEWNLLREQFHALMREVSDNIENILDAQFCRRFGELINRTAERENIKAAGPPESNLILHLRKYTAHKNMQKKRKRKLSAFGPKQT